MSARAAKLVFLAVLALYGLSCLRNPGAGGFLDSIDLAIHETGHLVFGAFGEFIQFAGGTLFQLIVPATFMAYFLRRGDRYGAAVCLWWVAQNLCNISVYVADARAQELPLVGGGEHDWAYLLGRLRLLQHDRQLATMVHNTGVLVYLGALAMGTRAVLRPPPVSGSTPETVSP